MTRVVFAGPSLYGADLSEFGDLHFEPPVSFGDVFRATEQGAKIIGIIDGHFEQTASVWHKEILAALSRGVQVLGGGSMGALRAAECARFGMVPVGKIAQAYCSGELTSDGDVAVTNGPAEAGFVPLSEALVDALATIDRLGERKLITRDEQAKLAFSARRLFFKDRTARSIVAKAQLGPRTSDVQRAYKAHRRSIKREDALALVRAVQSAETTSTPAREPASWFNNSTIWHNVSRQLATVMR